MLLLFATHHHIARALNSVPQDNLDFKQVAQAIQFTFAIIALIAAAVYFWADYKDRKEINALLKKNGIKED